MRQFKEFGVILILVSVLMGYFFTDQMATAQTVKTGISEGSVLPPFKLKLPADPNIQKYLGVQDQTEFKLSQISSSLILIDILSVLCTDCHKNAPYVNRLYNIIENDPALQSVKILGIAAGDNAKLADAYKHKYKVRFPLFPDPEDELGKLFAGTGPPAMIITNTKGKVLFIHEGVIEDMDFLLEVIRSIQKEEQ